MKVVACKLIALAFLVFSANPVIYADSDKDKRVSNSAISFNINEFSQGGLDSLEDISYFLPNFSVSASSTLGHIAPVITVRGAVDRSVHIINPAAVSLYYNDVYLSGAQNALITAADVNRITVSYGSNGVDRTYGNNGGLSYKTSSATPGTYFAFRGGLGSINEINYTQLANVEFSKKAFGRLVVTGNTKGSNINGASSDKAHSIQGSLVFHPTSKWNISLSADNIENEVSNDVDITSIKAVDAINSTSATPYQLLSAALEQHTQIGAGKVAGIRENDIRIVSGDFFSPGYCLLDSNDSSYASRNTGAGSASVATDKDVIGLGDNYAFKGCENINVNTTRIGKIEIGYAPSNNISWGYVLAATDTSNDAVFDRTGLGIAAENQMIESETIQQGFHLDYKGKHVNFTGGISLINEKSMERGINYNAIGTGTANVDFSVAVSATRKFVTDSDSVINFAQIDYNPHKKINIALSGQNVSSDVVAMLKNSQVNNGDTDSRSGTFTSNYYRLAVNYNPIKHSVFYISAGRRNNPGGFNSHAETASKTYKKEKVTSYELGVKSQLIQNKLAFDLVFFRENYNDRQTLSQQGNTTFVTNLTKKDVSIQGVEGTFRLKANNALSFFGAIGIVEAKVGGSTDNRLPYVSEMNSTIGGKYIINIKGRPLNIEVVYTTIGDMITSLTASENNMIESRSEFNLGASYQMSSDLRAYIVCRNCSDQVNSTGVFSDTVVKTAYRANRRNISAGVEYKF